jgi:cytochrome P450 / NADPH-cytochrome P450 reductase
MNGLVDRLVAERRAQGDAADDTDLLAKMLTGVDRKTDERLPDDNIRDQCPTFLVAGHETMSGLLSFATYYVLENPTCWPVPARRSTRCWVAPRHRRSSRCSG